MHAVDTVRIPRFALLERSEEHFVHPQRIGTVIFNDMIGIHHIEHRLRHLFDRPAAQVFTVLENKFRIGELGTPGPERLQIEQVVAHDVHIDMNLLGIVLVFQPQRHEFIRTDDTVYEIRAPLDHTLIHEFPERFAFANIPQIVKEHVPETRIHQVPGGMFDPADIKVDTAPVFVRFAAYERIAVVRIHITQVIS